jgi:hypothetical protein
VNILILANHYPVASGRYVRDALRRLGHTVYTDGPAMGTRVWGLTLPPWTEWTPEPPPHGDLSTIDLAIVMDSDPALLDYAEWYKRAGIHKEFGEHKRVIVWGVDNHVRDYRRPWFNHYYLAHLHPSIMPWLPDMVHVPCGYDPVLFTPSPIPFAERRYDVAILGVMYPDRLRAVDELRGSGLKVIAGCGLVGESYVQAHHDSRVALCLPATNDVAMRVMECAAMGNMVMTPWLPDFQKLRPRGLYLVRAGVPLADQVRDAMTQAEHIPEAQAWAANYTWDKLSMRVLEGK